MFTDSHHINFLVKALEGSLKNIHSQAGSLIQNL